MDPVLGGLILGGASMFGGAMTNAANARQQSEAVARQMAWQTEMANTAHQREVKDLRAAGLNPALSAMGGSGAATPTGSANAAVMEDTLGKGISSGLEMARYKKELKAVDSQIALNEASAETQKSQRALNASNAAAAQESALLTMGKYREQDITNRALEAGLPASMARSRADYKQALFDEKASTFDSYMRRADQLMGVGSSAASILKPTISIRREKENERVREEHKKMKDFLDYKYGK